MIKNMVKILIVLFDMILGIVPLVLGFLWETVSDSFCSGRCYSKELADWIKD